LGLAGEDLMARARQDNSGIHRHYGAARARRFAAKLLRKATFGKRKRRTEKRSRQFNLMRAKGKR
jgi:hypothetical protein